MTLWKVFDAAFPPATAPPGAQAVLGYIGRPGFMPHVWTAAEWDRFADLRQFPAAVPDFANDPKVEAAWFADAMKALGWEAHAVPARVLLVDEETRSQDAAWYQMFAAELVDVGFVAVEYGSLSTVLANSAYDVWAADWDGIPQLVPGQTEQGKQYKAGVPWQGTMIDLSVVDDWLWERAGRGARHG